MMMMRVSVTSLLLILSIYYSAAWIHVKRQGLYSTSCKNFFPMLKNSQITSASNKIRHLMFIAHRRRSICSSRRHHTSSRSHCGLVQVVQTSTRSIRWHGAFFSSRFTAGKSNIWMSCDRVSLRTRTSAWLATQSNNDVDVFALVWLQRADISSKCLKQYCLAAYSNSLKLHLCQVW